MVGRPRRVPRDGRSSRAGADGAGGRAVRRRAIHAGRRTRAGLPAGPGLACARQHGCTLGASGRPVRQSPRTKALTATSTAPMRRSAPTRRRTAWRASVRCENDISPTRSGARTWPGGGPRSAGRSLRPRHGQLDQRAQATTGPWARTTTAEPAGSWGPPEVRTMTSWPWAAPSGLTRTTASCP